MHTQSMGVDEESRPKFRPLVMLDTSSNAKEVFCAYAVSTKIQCLTQIFINNVARPRLTLLNPHASIGVR